MLREAVSKIILVLPDSLHEIRSHAEIQCSIAFAGKNADAGLLHHADRGRESLLLPLPPNRTGGFPAYGSPVGGFTWLRVDELHHHRKEIRLTRNETATTRFSPRGRQHA